MKVKERFCKFEKWNSVNIFCTTCITNQNLFLELVQSKDIYEKHLIDELERRYPIVCNICKSKVDKHIHELNAKLPQCLSRSYAFPGKNLEQNGATQKEFYANPFQYTINLTIVRYFSYNLALLSAIFIYILVISDFSLWSRSLLYLKLNSMVTHTFILFYSFSVTFLLIQKQKPPLLDC